MAALRETDSTKPWAPASFFQDMLPETVSMDFYIPGILRVADLAELPALMAPRYFGVDSLLLEKMKQGGGGQEPFAFARKVYEVMGAADKFISE